MPLMSPTFTSPLMSPGRPTAVRQLDGGRFSVKVGSTSGGLASERATFTPRIQASTAASAAQAGNAPALTPEQQAAIGGAIGDGIRGGIDAIFGDKTDPNAAAAAAAAEAARKKEEQKKMIMLAAGAALVIVVLVVVMKKRG